MPDKRRTAVPANPNRTKRKDRNNSKDHLIGFQSISQEPEKSLYREADQSTAIADSIYSLIFEPIPADKMGLIKGTSNLNIEDEQDSINALKDVYRQNKALLDTIELPKKDLKSWEVMSLVNKKVFEKYPQEYYRTIAIEKDDNEQFYLKLKEQIGFDGFYWISITWLMEKCKDEDLKQLCFFAIAMLGEHCKMVTLGDSNDEYYKERMEQEVEYFEEELAGLDKKRSDYESCVNDLNDSINFCKSEIICYDTGEYNQFFQKIHSYTKFSLEHFDHHIKKYTPKTRDQKKIYKWIRSVQKLILSGFTIWKYDINEADAYENGEVPVQDMMRFIYTRDSKYPLYNICIDLEESANNNGVSTFILDNKVSDNNPQIDVPDDLKLAFHVMNFEDIYEKWK